MKTVANLICLLALCAGGLRAADTEGTVKLEFATEHTDSSKYAPRHVVAVWVADAQTNFVKTVMRLGNKRHTKLHTWNKARQGDSAVDGVTGATVASHQAHTATWNCRDAENKVVADGTYLLFVEFTESNNQGPVAVIPFKKGVTAEDRRVEGLKGFSSVKISFAPGPAK
jgi:hypothetical protein